MSIRRRGGASDGRSPASNHACSVAGLACSFMSWETDLFPAFYQKQQNRADVDWADRMNRAGKRIVLVIDDLFRSATVVDACFFCSCFYFMFFVHKFRSRREAMGFCFARASESMCVVRVSGFLRLDAECNN